jgi:hypothetical protein
VSTIDQTPATQVDERNLMARLRHYVSTYCKRLVCGHMP